MDNERWHGTRGGYINHGCHCDLCRVANNAWCAGRKSVRKENAQRGVEADIGNTSHGSETGYQRGCQCDPCRAAHSDYNSSTHQIRKFRNSPEGKKLWEECGGMCMKCRTSPAAVVDHIHGTRKIRGYLCHGCNTGIGKLGDTIEGVQEALDYLRANPGVELVYPG